MRLDQICLLKMKKVVMGWIQDVNRCTFCYIKTREEYFVVEEEKKSIIAE